MHGACFQQQLLWQTEHFYLLYVPKIKQEKLKFIKVRKWNGTSFEWCKTIFGGTRIKRNKLNSSNFENEMVRRLKRCKIIRQICDWNSLKIKRHKLDSSNCENEMVRFFFKMMQNPYDKYATENNKKIKRDKINSSNFENEMVRFLKWCKIIRQMCD